MFPSAEEDGDGRKAAEQSREGSQAAIQRRKKPKRRSTGVVHLDMQVRNSNVYLLQYQIFII